MATEIGGIKVKIGADTSGFETGLKKTRTGINQVGKWATAAAAAAVVGAAAIVNSQRKVLDSLAKTSDALGIQQEKLQALQHIGELTGTSNEMVNKSLERMQKNLGNAARMGGASADALEDLGVNVKEIINLSPDKQMEELARALSSVDNQSLKASISNDIFGRSGVRMLKMMEQLKSEGLDPTVEAIDKMGISLSRIETSKVENANDALFKASEVVTGLANKLTVKLSPLLEEVANRFIDAAVEGEGFGNVIDKAFTGAITVVGLFADGLHGVQIIFKTLEVAAIGFSTLAVKVFEGVTDLIAMSVDGWIMIINDAIRSMNSMIGTDLEELPEIKSSKFVTGVTDVAASMVGLVADTSAELHDLVMQELPSEQLKAFVEEVELAATAASEAMTNAPAFSGGGGEGGTETPDKDGALKAQQAIESLMLLNESKLEEITRFEEERKALIDGYLDNELISKADHEAAMTAIDADAAQARLAIAEAEKQAKMAALGGMFGDLSSLMNSKSKKLFKVGQLAAVANATIDGISAAVSAWKAGMAFGGPIGAAAFAGASVLKTGAMIQQISSQSFGSPAAPVSFSGGVPAVTTANGGGQQQQSSNISIDIVGSEGATFSRDAVIGLIGQINDATSDGVSLNTGG